MRNRIIQLQKQSGLTERQFALQCGLKQNTVWDQIKGKSKISADTITAILAFFPNVSAEWLLRGTGEMYLKEENNPEIIALNNVIADLTETLKNKNKTIALLQQKINELENH